MRLLNRCDFRAGVGGACCLNRRGIEIHLRFQRSLFNSDDDTVVLLVRPNSLVEILDGIVTERDRLHGSNTPVDVQLEFDQLFRPRPIHDLRRGVAAIFDRENPCVQYNNKVRLYVYKLIFDICLVRSRTSTENRLH